MRHKLTLLILLIVSINSFGQIRNTDELLRKLKVKTQITYYYQSEDTLNSTGRLLIEKRFNDSGLIEYEYEFIFWDVVSYDFTTTYIYDENGNLLEKTKIQKILNLGKRDQDYIDALGADPINDKTINSYNEDGLLISQKNFTFGDEGFDENSNCQTINYNYSNDKLIKEISSTPNGSLASENYETAYKYNSQNNIIEELTTYKENGKKKKYFSYYQYNDNNKLIEKTIIYDDSPYFNRKFKYEYDDKDRLIKELKYDSKQEKWIVLSEFQYNAKGNRFEKDEQTKYEFYSNGLIKMELWKSDKSDEIVNFVSKYEYYK